MFEKSAWRRAFAVAVILPALVACPLSGQDAAKKGGSVPITFVPPPIENATYSVGIYEAKSGKLVRRLCEAAGQNTFKIGLNGLITSWDGQDDDGKPLPPGKYAARGYAVGPMKVEGEAILGNDWAGDDESLRIERVEAIAFLPTNGLAVLAAIVGGPDQVACFSDADGGKLRWHKALPVNVSPKVSSGRTSDRLTVISGVLVADAGGDPAVFQISDGAPGHFFSGYTRDDTATVSHGKGGTVWKIEEGDLSQYSAQGEKLRKLAAKPGEPTPLAVSASEDDDRLYLLEATTGWQRVRGLSWIETKEESGKRVSSWQTFFERNIRAPDPALELEDAATAKLPSPTVEITLAENPLAASKRERVKLTASFDAKGSYLSTSDGLRLRQISERTHLRAVKLVKDKAPNELLFFQTDGAAWDQFSVRTGKEVIGFDAGEFEIDATGEKLNAEKAPEPDL